LQKDKGRGSFMEEKNMSDQYGSSGDQKRHEFREFCFKVLRLLSNISNSIPLDHMGVIRGLKINILTEMKNEGLILIENDSVKITEKGRKIYEEH
jgi:predicted transcriptional regulator